ncbi:MAG: serine/threonine protein kinase [Planctomycetes bacterium]|nr:serine/threonine protein kinase [Planctomycetota bacterium]
MVEELKDSFIGRDLGTCELMRKIGEGGMGAVYLAHHKRLDKNVAVKILPVSFSKEEDRVKRFVREARSTAKLDHPNIIQIFDIQLAKPGGFYFIIMQYIDGDNLDMRIKKQGKLPIPEAIRIIKSAASALGAAHSMGIIHRDIKAENIMLSKNGEIKLMDFGLARIGDSSSSISSAGDIMGTPHYMAPEQAKGEPIDHRADIYALGITFYYALTGKRPFDGATPVTVIMKHLNEEPPDPTLFAPDIPKNLVKILLKMMAKDPKSRYQSAQDLLNDLDNFIIETPSAMSSTAKTVTYTPLPTTKTSAPKLKKGLKIAGIIILVLLALMFISKIGRKRDQKPDQKPPDTAQKEPEKKPSFPVKKPFNDMLKEARDFLDQNPTKYKESMDNFEGILLAYPDDPLAPKIKDEISRLKKEYEKHRKQKQLEAALLTRCNGFCEAFKNGNDRAMLSYFNSDKLTRLALKKLEGFLKRVVDYFKSHQIEIEKYTLSKDELKLDLNAPTPIAEINVIYHFKKDNKRDTKLQTLQWVFQSNEWYLMPGQQHDLPFASAEPPEK